MLSWVKMYSTFEVVETQDQWRTRWVSKNDEYLKVRERGKSDRAESVADEVQEGSTEGDESSVSSQTIADGCWLRPQKVFIAEFGRKRTYQP